MWSWIEAIRTCNFSRLDTIKSLDDVFLKVEKMTLFKCNVMPYVKAFKTLNSGLIADPITKDPTRKGEPNFIFGPVIGHDI